MEGFFSALENQAFWLFLIYSFLTPLIRQRMLKATCLQAIAALERQRGMHVIALISRQDLLGASAAGGNPFDQGARGQGETASCPIERRYLDT